MKAKKAFHAIAVVAAILCTTPLWAAGMGQADQGQTQTASQDWSRFGPSHSSLSPKSSGWHYFGAADAEPRAADSAPKTTSSALKPYPSPHSGSTSALEHQMYDLINRDRLDPANTAETGGRAQALRWNATLAAAARAHSRDMLQQRFFAHVDREGRSPGTRVKAAGIEWQAVGENIAIYEKVSSAQAAFMNEPRFGHNHRSNVLDPKYTDVGVGIVEAPDGRYYITQEFVETPQSLRASF
jgi:uncharacterized protein YkwD